MNTEQTALTFESGSLNFQNNIVRSNQNGIMVNGGSITVENNEITNNTVSGVNIAGGSQVTVQNNVISSNGDGIVLTGNLTGNINIAQNNILLNNGQLGYLLTPTPIQHGYRSKQRFHQTTMDFTWQQTQAPTSPATTFQTTPTESSTKPEMATKPTSTTSTTTPWAWTSHPLANRQRNLQLLGRHERPVPQLSES